MEEWRIAATLTGGRAPLRANVERTVTAILEAAERTLARDPTATMERIADAAGVVRTTVHRRFATRDALVDALAVWATRRCAAAVEAAHPDTAPPLVALYQATANVLGVRASWGFAMSPAAATSRTPSADAEVARIHDEVRETCERLLGRARDAGILRADVDIPWVRRVYSGSLVFGAWVLDTRWTIKIRRVSFMRRNSPKLLTA